MSSIKLYHVSNTEIRVPDIRKGRRNADFAQGFYLSRDKEFVLRWAAKDAVLNTYELSTGDLKIRRLERSKEWFDYIFANRRAKKDTLEEFDVIAGPIANDTIYNTMGIITSGFLSSDEALELLMIGPEYEQTAIKTDKAAAALRWISSEKVTEETVNRYKELVKTEEAEYMRQFSETMEKLSR